ncbi:hypothetical protein [Paenibacillus kobensis]|uniref:hypothetical protein n=1 Tax=Paenibacillus kobensis TaxID=59841 RepID=UPI000FDB5205|nr:hypothetical protein [Paenibacillus kobensis]
MIIQITDSKFVDSVVEVDGNSYVNCTFTNCTFVTATGNYSFDKCSFNGGSLQPVSGSNAEAVVSLFVGLHGR